MRATRLAGLVLLLVGCGIEELDRRALPILNGVEDTGHPAIGMLGNIFCTATLVGSRTVLTAAHCLQEKSTYTIALGTTTYTAARVIPHPDWTEVSSLPELPNANWKFSVNDIGVLLLKDQVVGIEPMPLASHAPKVGQTVTLVGYGVTTSGGGGTKHKVDNTVGAVGAGFVLFGNIGGLTGGDGLTCTGDSGGPALVVEEGEERVLAVHSMAICGKYSQCTRVAPYLGWLAEKSEGNLGVAADATPPEILFESPKLDATQPPDFEVVVTITDAGGLRSATLFVDGQERLSTDQARLKLGLTGLGEGDHELKVVAIDRAANRAELIQRVRVRRAAETQPPGETAPGAAGCHIAGGRAGSGLPLLVGRGSSARTPGRPAPLLVGLLALLLVLRRTGSRAAPR